MGVPVTNYRDWLRGVTRFDWGIYGAQETARSYGMCFTGSYLAGTASPTYDDGSNDHALVHQSPVPF